MMYAGEVAGHGLERSSSNRPRPKKPSRLPGWIIWPSFGTSRRRTERQSPAGKQCGKSNGSTNRILTRGVGCQAGALPSAFDWVRRRKCGKDVDRSSTTRTRNLQSPWLRASCRLRSRVGVPANSGRFPSIPGSTSPFSARPNHFTRRHFTQSRRRPLEPKAFFSCFENGEENPGDSVISTPTDCIVTNVRWHFLREVPVDLPARLAEVVHSNLAILS